MVKMKILLTGANGYLGARLFFDLREHFDVIGTYNHNQLCKDFIPLDITNENQIHNIFQKYKPDIVLHTANYATARAAVNNEEEFQQVNLDSTKFITEAANEIQAKVIFTSSFAALTPNDIYGELKELSEKIIKTGPAGYLILRPSLILGYSPNTTNDRPFNRLLKHLDNTTLAEMDTSWQFQPTYIGHISEVIKTAIKKNIWNKTVHVFCPAIQSRYSTARDILEPFGITVKPIDQHMTIPLQERDEQELIDLGLPTCSYEEMVKKIHGEIENGKKFRL